MEPLKLGDIVKWPAFTDLRPNDCTFEITGFDTAQYAFIRLTTNRYMNYTVSLNALEKVEKP